MPLIFAVDVPEGGVFHLKCGCRFRKTEISETHKVQSEKFCGQLDAHYAAGTHLGMGTMVHYDPLASELEERFG